MGVFRLAILFAATALAVVTPVDACEFLALNSAAAVADDAADLRSYLTANGLLNRGMFELAIPEYERFLNEHADHDKANHARYGLAVCHFQLDRRDKALEALTRLNEEASSFEYAAEVDLLRAHCHFNAAQYAVAAGAFAEVIEAAPDHASADDAAALLVESLYRAGEREEAAIAGIDALARWPESDERSRAELFLGLSLAALGRDEEALPHFDQALRRDPDGALAPHAELAQARSLDRLGRVALAIEAYRRVLVRNNSDLMPEALLALADLQRDYSASEAATLLERLLREYPKSPLVTTGRFQLARIHYGQDDFSRAQRGFDEILAGGDQSLRDDASYWSARCILKAGRSDAAAEALASAISEFPESDLLDEMMYDRAAALLRAGQMEEARAALIEFRRRFSGGHALDGDALSALISIEFERSQFERALALVAEFSATHADHVAAASVEQLAAESLYRLERFDDAAAAAERWLEAYADHASAPDMRRRLGMCLYRLGRFGEADAQLRSALAATNAESSPSAAVLFALGDIAFERDDWPEAERCFAAWLQSESESPAAGDALLKLGLALARQGRHDDAIARFNEIVREHQESGANVEHALFELGQSELVRGRAAEAERAFRQLIDRNEESRFASHAMRRLASIAQNAGRYEEAADWLARAIETGDESHVAQAHFDRGVALMAAGQFDAAADAFGDAATSAASEDESLSRAARANRAIAWSRAGENEKALDAALDIEADKLDTPLAAALRYERAWLLRDAGRSEEAAAEYAALLDAAPQNDDRRMHALLDLASIEMDSGAIEPAARRLEELLSAIDSSTASSTASSPATATASPPDDKTHELLREQATYRLGVCVYKLSRFDRVVELFGDFARRWPRSDLAPAADLMAGEANLRLGRHEQAAEHLARATNESSDPEILRPALLRLGEAQGTLHQWALSAETFTTFLERFTDDDLWFQARFGVGWALENQARYDAAIREYRDIVDRHQGATAARAQFQIGQCLFAQKKHEDALRELLRVDILYAYPEWSAAALYEAGRCLLAMSRPHEAVAQFEQVIEHFEDTQWAALAREKLASAEAALKLPGR